MARLFTAASSQYGYQFGSTTTYGYPYFLSCWIYPTNLTGTLCPFSICNETNHERTVLFIGSLSNGLLTLQSYSQNVTGINNTTSFSLLSYLNKWVHICGYARSDGVSVLGSVYVNGVAPGGESTLYASSQNCTTRAAYIGTRNNSGTVTSAFFNGGVAYPTIWNAVLNQEEIISLSQGVSSLSIRPSKIIFYSDLNTDSTTYDNQLISPSPNLKLINNPTITDNPNVRPR